MAIDNRLQVFNEEGQSVDYDILASDVKFLPDGKDLPTKLAEMEQEIEDAGQGDGTVKGVKMNNGYPIEPDGDGVVDLGTVITQHQDISGKVDKETGKSLMSADEHTKLAGIEAGAEKNIIKGVKANGASTNLPVDQNGVVELPPAGSTISPATAAPSMDGNNAAVGISDKYAREDHVHPHDSSKQNTLTPGTGISLAQNGTISVDADNTPTPDSPKPVTSGGVSTALHTLLSNIHIGVNGNWWVGPETDANNDTGIKAQGPKGNSVADGDTFDIVNNLTDGGEADALSAEMGTVLKAQIIALWAAIGEYAFPGGRPMLDFSGGSQSLIAEISTIFGSNVTPYSGESDVSLGDSLTVQLSTTDDLYVINPSSVKVLMGGVDVTSSYYNQNTDVVNIPSVLDDVEIKANAMTYVQDDLVLHLDCRHRGGTGTEVSGHWKSLVNYGQSPIDFTLKSGVTAADTGMVFDGSTNAYADTDTQLNVLATAGTIEAVATGLNDSFNTILVNPIENAIGLSIHNASYDSSHKNAVIMMGRNDSNYPEGTTDPRWAGRVGDTTTDFAIAMTAGTPTGVGHNKGESLTVGRAIHLVVDPTYHNKLAIGCRLRASSPNYLNGTIKAIRVYSSHLTADQQLQNWLVDKKRFNL